MPLQCNRKSAAEVMNLLPRTKIKNGTLLREVHTKSKQVDTSRINDIFGMGITRHNTYHRSSIKPSRGLFNFGHSRVGVDL